MSTTTTMTMTSPTPQSTEGQHYTTLPNPIKEMPPVVIFFSFLDSTSREWAAEYNIAHAMRKRVPAGTEVTRFHSAAPYAKEFGEDLTHAWAVARSLQIDDRVIGPLFDAIQGQTKATDMEGVKAVFDHVGMPPMRFDAEGSKKSVVEEAKWMDECRERLNITQLPSLVVAGKYLIKPDAFGDQFSGDKLAEVVKHLLGL